MSDISEADFIELKKNIENYVNTDNEIKKITKNMKDIKIQKNELYNTIKETMIKNEISELKTDVGTIKITTSIKKKPISEENIKSAILSKIKNVNKTPVEYGYIKLVDIIINAIQNDRETTEVVNLKFSKKK
jgi:hypothetical protein